MSYRFNVHLQSAPHILNELAKVAVRHGMDPTTRIMVMCYGSRPTSTPMIQTSASICRTRKDFHNFNQSRPLAIRSHMEAPVSREQFWYEATLPLEDLHAYHLCAMTIELGSFAKDRPMHFSVEIDTASTPCWLFTDKVPFKLPGRIGHASMQPCAYKPDLSVSRMTLDHTGLARTEIKYLDGTTVWVDPYMDVLHLRHPVNGTITEACFVFHGAYYISNELLQADFDGIFGFGLSPTTSTTILPTFLGTLIGTGYISSPEMTLGISKTPNNSYVAIGTPPPAWGFGFSGPIAVVTDEVYWKVPSTTHNINGHQASFVIDNTAIIDSATSIILLAKTTVDQFYSLIPEQYTAKAGQDESIWYISRTTPILSIPTLSIALGDYFLHIDPAVILDADQDSDPNLPFIPGKIQSREISGLTYDILGTPALLCMVANFKHGLSGVRRINREDATFSFRQKSIYDFQ